MKQAITDKEVFPKELTLLVTGTGVRSDETSDQLLFRTCDAALYFDRNDFNKLPHELIERYNNYQSLLDSNRELTKCLRQMVTILETNKGMTQKYNLNWSEALTAINNTKNINI